MIARAARALWRSTRLAVAGRDGVAYVVALAMAAIVAVTGAAYALLARSEAEIARAQIASLQATYVAEAGVEYGLRALKKDKGTSAWSGVTDQAFGPGTFTVAVDRNALRPDGIDFHSVEITSTGAIDGKYKRTVRRRFHVYPTMFTLALYSQTQYQNQGSGTVITGGSAVGTYASFPSIRWTTLSGLATQSYSGNVDWSVNGQTKDGIYYIDGNLTIGGASSQIDGTLIVTGDVTISSGAAGSTLTVSPGKKTWPAGLVVGGAFTVGADNVTINGRVFVASAVSIQKANLNLNGGLYAGSSIQIASGATNNKVTYRPAVVEDADEYFYYTSGQTPARSAKVQAGHWYLFP